MSEVSKAERARDRDALASSRTSTSEVFKSVDPLTLSLSVIEFERNKLSQMSDIENRTHKIEKVPKISFELFYHSYSSCCLPPEFEHLSKNRLSFLFLHTPSPSQSLLPRD